MSTPADNIGKDSLVWGLEVNGAFSIRSAYLMLSNLDQDHLDNFWSRLWKWKGPTQLIAWRPGEEGWFTLNTDGSRISQSGATAIGGIIRDSTGKLVRAFCANVGNCSITRAELRAIVEGLKLAWSLGIKKVAVQSDSAAAVAMLQAGAHSTHKHAALVAEYLEIRARPWEISLTHIFREANCSADYLAN
ncbi:Putative ribonuclease H protein At1g65750 [Linum perenne]